MNKEDNRMFYNAIGNSIQENKDRIEKLEKQNANYKKAKKKLQQKNKQLKDNWDKLKEHIETCLNEAKQNDVYDRNEYETGIITGLDSSLYKMRELEGDSNDC